ncbi:MAG: hypothetical protein IJS15_05975 [Victivallales bacterium]|nr:hypothetical protein [Victivallales bacterium]
MSYLGIDIGSSQTKAVVFNGDGVQLASSGVPYQYTVPQIGWMELDGNTVLDAAFKVIADCAAAVAATDPVETITASSQGEAFSPIDAHGRIMAPAMISGDSRSAEVMDEFTASFGLDKIYRITGHTPSPMFSIAKLLYIKKHSPEIWNNAVKYLCFEDLLVHALTGKAVMGWPLAGRTMLFDINEHHWSTTLLGVLGLREDQFSEPVPCGTVVGNLRPEIADRLGLARSVQVVSGGHDQIIGAFGCGATTPGTAMYAAGSVECFVPVFDIKILSEELCRCNLCTYDFAESGKYASVAYSLTGSNFMEYFIREFAPDRGKDYAMLLGEMPEEPTDILVLPYLTPSGTPYFDTVTPGCIHGWRFGQSRGALLKAAEEGIALEMKLNFEFLKNSGIKMSRLIATGGGFRAKSKVQLRSDVLNLPITTIDVKEAGCRGAASLGMRALTGQTLPPPVATGVVTPHPHNAEFYSEKFKRYRKFSDAMRLLSKAL